MTALERGNNPSSEAKAWADWIIGGKPGQPPLEDVATDTPGRSYRVPPGTEIFGVGAEQIDFLDRVAREAVWLDQVYTERLPLVKQTFIDFARTYGVRGVTRDADHGNFRVTAVPQRQVVFDDTAIRTSLQDKADRVYVPTTEIRLAFGPYLETADGIKLSPDRVFEILRHALLGVNVSEQFLDRNMVKRLIETRDNLELAKIIREGMLVEGISFGIESWRTEIDAVNKHRAITVKRPRYRKNLISSKAGSAPSPEV